jgi:hypothetical protein
LEYAISFRSNLHTEVTLTTFTQFSSHVLLPGSGKAFYGAEATFDVYGFNLHPGQISTAAIWITDKALLSGIQAGWHVSYLDLGARSIILNFEITLHDFKYLMYTSFMSSV